MTLLRTKEPGSRQRRRTVIALALTIALAGGFAFGVLHAADPRLDLADASLEKAFFLLLASEPGPVDDKAVHEFGKHVEQAMTYIERAREEIALAKSAVDTP